MTSKLRLAFPFHRELDPHTSSLFFSVPHLKLSASLLELQYSQAHESHFHMANEDQEPHRTKKWRTGDNYPTNYRSRSSRNKAGVALSSYHKVLEKEISWRTLCLNSTGLWVLSQIHHAFPWLSDFLHAIPSTDCPCSERKSGTGPSLLVPRRNQPWSWTCSLQNCRKEVSAVWKESMVLCYGSWSKRAHQSSEGAWLKRKITEEYGGEKWKKTEPCR